jgi:hypothetical protein
VNHLIKHKGMGAVEAIRVARNIQQLDGEDGEDNDAAK